MDEILDYSKEHYGNDKNESLITALSVATEETKRFCDAALACEREAKRKFYEVITRTIGRLPGRNLNIPLVVNIRF